eukprot:TRINITY_DN7761_c0_g2_i2.p1 TRINITY_DN7761_c0_g2~~TRINITY_DN7761_c0_g2_i2.p1  ORF type:complete len:268 (-),score=31.97 TRINITY_DN7761_c0_g2_i2:34-837(-)
MWVTAALGKRIHKNTNRVWRQKTTSEEEINTYNPQKQEVGQYTNNVSSETNSGTMTSKKLYRLSRHHSVMGSGQTMVQTTRVRTPEGRVIFINNKNTIFGSTNGTIHESGKNGNHQNRAEKRIFKKIGKKFEARAGSPDQIRKKIGTSKTSGENIRRSIIIRNPHHAQRVQDDTRRGHHGFETEGHKPRDARTRRYVWTPKKNPSTNQVLANTEDNRKRKRFDLVESQVEEEEDDAVSEEEEESQVEVVHTPSKKKDQARRRQTQEE